MTQTTKITEFQVGKKYSCRSVCDYDSKWSFLIVKRTKNTITTSCGKTLRFNRQLTEYNNAETVFPLGKYSMAPILSADKIDG